METFALVLSLIIGDPETGPVHYFIIDHGITLEDCMRDLEDQKDIWLGSNNVGMFCEMEG